jgi:hypothetical protein
MVENPYQSPQGAEQPSEVRPNRGRLKWWHAPAIIGSWTITGATVGYLFLGRFFRLENDFPIDPKIKAFMVVGFWSSVVGALVFAIFAATRSR